MQDPVGHQKQRLWQPMLQVALWQVWDMDSRMPSNGCVQPYLQYFSSSAEASGPRGQWLPKQSSGCRSAVTWNGMAPYFLFSEGFVQRYQVSKDGKWLRQGHCKAPEVPQNQMGLEAFYMRLRQRMSWWSQHCQNQDVLKLIRHGVTTHASLSSKLSF